MNTIKPLSCKFCHQPCDINILDDISRATIIYTMSSKNYSWKCMQHENKVYYHQKLLSDYDNDFMTEFRCYHNKQMYTINIHENPDFINWQTCEVFKISLPKPKILEIMPYTISNITAEKILELSFIPNFTPENVANKLSTYLPFL